MAIDLNDPEVQSAIQQAGFMSKDQVDKYAKDYNSTLEANKNDILNQLKDTKARLSSLPIDPEKLTELASDGRFKKILDGGFDSYEQGIDATTAQRLEALRTDKMMVEQEFMQKEKSYAEQLTSYETELKHTKIENKLQNLVFSHQGEIVDTAIPDLIQYAKQELDFDNKGNLAVKDSNGTFQQSAEGNKTEADWLKDKMKTKPHWFVGAAGSQHGRSKFGNIDTTNMSAAEKMSLGRRKR